MSLGWWVALALYLEGIVVIYTMDEDDGRGDPIGIVLLRFVVTLGWPLSIPIALVTFVISVIGDAIYRKIGRERS